MMVTALRDTYRFPYGSALQIARKFRKAARCCPFACMTVAPTVLADDAVQGIAA
ncbi:hypothetical protein LN449_19755 [Xanthomonas cannabis]|uniref:hypothetical protein n=1 Tax=Xanthomonas cannabis TaxID=1885674 RepID=UPI001E4C5A5F|nr:hypothetical protein [Xanthomonas cannabis]MCC8444729.1 hypothetical protein [Xanthomonas cannabis]